MTAINFPSSPANGATHDAANGLKYQWDGVKWTSLGKYTTGAIGSQKLDDITFNGTTGPYDLKSSGETVKPENALSLNIVLAGTLKEPNTDYTVDSVNGTITFSSTVAAGTDFWGVVLPRLPFSQIPDAGITDAKVASNAAIAGTKINPDFGSQGITTTGKLNVGDPAGSGPWGDEIKINSKTPELHFLDSTDDPDYKIRKQSGNFMIMETGQTDDSQWRLSVRNGGKVDIPGDLDVGDDLDVAGNITVTGTVDGRDIAADGATLDSLSTGGGEPNVQVDWNQTTNTADDFIKNKPTIPSAQVSSDWNSSSGVSQILNKPSLFSGSYADLTNKPQITLEGANQTKWTGDLFTDHGTGNKLKLGRASADGATPSVLEFYTNPSPSSSGGDDKDDCMISATGHDLLIYAKDHIVLHGGLDNNGANVKRFETTSNGVQVQGRVTADYFFGDGSNLTNLPSGGSSGEANQNAFSNIVVSGQTTVAADSTTDSLTLTAGDNVTITTDASADSVTINSEVTASNVNAVFTDDTQLQLGTVADTSDSNNPDNSNQLKLYYDGSGHHGIINVTRPNPTVAGNYGVIIQHNGSPRLEVDEDGTQWTGDLHCTDEQTIKIGGDAALQLWHTTGGGSNEHSEIRSNTGNLVIYTKDGLLIEDIENSGHYLAKFIPEAAAELYWDGSTDRGKKLETTETGVTVTGNIAVTGTVDSRDLQTDGTKLDGIAANANNYSLPTAASNVIGGIKVGTNLSIDGNGVLSSSQLSLNKSLINALYGDNDQLMLGNGTADGGDDTDTLKLYYDGSNGFITADGGVNLQYNGDNRVLITDDGITVAGNITLSTADATVDGVNLNGGGNDTSKFLNGNGGWTTPTLSSIAWTNVTSSPQKLTVDSSGNTKWTGDLYVDSDDGTNGGKLKIGNDVVNNVAQAALTIYHDGSSNDQSEHNSIIDAGPNDNLLVYGSNIYFEKHNADPLEYMAKFEADGAVQLYYDGSSKFETLSGGVKAHGHIFLNNNNKFIAGNGSDLQIYHNGTNGVIQNSTNILYISGPTGVRLQYDGASRLSTITNGAIQLYGTSGDQDDADADPVAENPTLAICHDSVDRTSEVIRFQRNNNGTMTNPHNIRYHSIFARHSGNADANFIKFALHQGGGNTTTEWQIQKIPFELYPKGAKWNGDLYCDDYHWSGDGVAGNKVNRIALGNESALQILHKDDDSSGSTSEQAEIRSKHNLDFYYDAVKKLQVNATGIEVTGANLIHKHSTWMYHQILADTNDAVIKLGSNQSGVTEANENIWAIHNDTDQLYRLNFRWEGSTRVDFETDGTVQAFHFKSMNNSTQIKLGASEDLKIYHNGSDAHFANTTGEVLIFTAANSGLKIQVSNTSNYLAEFRSNATYLHQVATGAGNSDLRYDTSNGQVTYDTSTRLVKDDIEDINYGLNIINQLKPRRYKRNDDNNKVEIGFIADEVLPLIPEIVPFGKKSLITKNEADTEDIPINVDYRKVCVVLTKAIQELSAKVTALENA